MEPKLGERLVVLRDRGRGVQVQHDGHRRGPRNIVRLALDRDAVVAAFREEGIGVSVHYSPLHLHPYYRRRWATTPEDFPVATHEYERVISLPIWPNMTTADRVQRVVVTFVSILESSSAVSARLDRAVDPSRVVESAVLARR